MTGRTASRAVGFALLGAGILLAGITRSPGTSATTIGFSDVSMDTHPFLLGGTALLWAGLVAFLLGGVSARERQTTPNTKG